MAKSNTSTSDAIIAFLYNLQPHKACELIPSLSISTINARDEGGATPLNAAAENGFEAVITKLLRAQADPNIADDEGLTPLHHALWTGGSEGIIVA